jgi:hypothetical protein
MAGATLTIEYFGYVDKATLTIEYLEYVDKATLTIGSYFDNSKERNISAMSVRLL